MPVSGSFSPRGSWGSPPCCQYRHHTPGSSMIPQKVHRSRTLEPQPFLIKCIESITTAVLPASSHNTPFFCMPSANHISAICGCAAQHHATLHLSNYIAIADMQLAVLLHPCIFLCRLVRWASIKLLQSLHYCWLRRPSILFIQIPLRHGHHLCHLLTVICRDSDLGRAPDALRLYRRLREDFLDKLGCRISLLATPISACSVLYQEPRTSGCLVLARGRCRALLWGRTATTSHAGSLLCPCLLPLLLLLIRL
eukprot:gnl/TRDRNA2_/TRDRNA2_87573_c0_seq1.p1 gnl/TRDRNA2_/TRDRNA2_87573_c0~~gnl/TRDRNA2_/TRDRNA2_87573_c0_seq1.p1  ORF type:complete len:292 (+),score=-21.77 gnl/TRDRNA2_/TRDRNA2_87573_c0_seq1:119-877(+)